MASAMRSTINFFKIAWETQPILFISCVMGAVAPVLILIGPGTKKGDEERRNWPTHYRLPENQSESKH